MYILFELFDYDYNSMTQLLTTKVYLGNISRLTSINIEDLFENIGTNIYRKKQVGGKKSKILGKRFKKTYKRKIYRRKTYKKKRR